MRLHTGGLKAKVGSGCSTPCGFTEVGIFCLLPSTFYLSGCCFSPQSKIDNPKSCVGPSAILTGSRTRPSDWGWNRRFGPVEDRRNNRRLATFTCTLCVLQIWWLSSFSPLPSGPRRPPLLPQVTLLGYSSRLWRGQGWPFIMGKDPFSIRTSA